MFNSAYDFLQLVVIIVLAAKGNIDSWFIHNLYSQMINLEKWEQKQQCYCINEISICFPHLFTCKYDIYVSHVVICTGIENFTGLAYGFFFGIF